MNEFIDKTAANWIELIWDLSIYYPEMEDAFEWANIANEILGIEDEMELEGMKDKDYEITTSAFCMRPVEYHPKRSKEFYEKYL